MKRLFTLAIVTMIASITFAQAPAQKSIKKKEIQKVVNVAAANQKMKEMKALEAKANAPQESSTSVLRKAVKKPVAAMSQQLGTKAIMNAKISPRKLSTRPYGSQLRLKNSAAIQKRQFVATENAPRLAVPKTEGEDDDEIEYLTATDSSQLVYEDDGDTFCVLLVGSASFRFDILEIPLVADKTYTLADMDSNYTGAKINGTSYAYEECTYTSNADGSSVHATCTISGTKFDITYTKPEAVEITDYQTIEFSADETDLYDGTDDGVFQFIGAKDDTGLAAYVCILSDQIAGSYTYEDDAYASYSRLYLDIDDEEGVAFTNGTINVEELEEGVYKATCVLDATNGTEYTLIFNYGTPSQGGDDDEPAAATVTTDAHGIITAVTGGTTKYYTRTGTAYYVSGQSMYYDDQSGTATVIEDGDDVYLLNPISRYSQNTWVKGTKVDNTIVFPTKQPLAWSTSYSATISMRWGLTTASGSISAADDTADNFVFTVDGDVLTLQGTESMATAEGDALFMGAFWDDDDSTTGYGDAETVLTLDPDYVAPSTELVVLPEGVTPADWYLNGASVSSSSSTSIKNQNVQVAFDGNDVYVKGVFSAFPNAWVKGTADGSTVTFEKGQFIGKSGTYNIWMMGVDPTEGTLIDATATLSEDNKTITFGTDLLANAKVDAVYYHTWLENVVLTAGEQEYVEPVITDLTAELPYTNTFDTEAEQAEVAIYDANEDGSTFSIVDNALRYKYNSSNEGNDYAVFPGLTLKAGTSYKVSVDARAYGASYPERIEVVAGTVAKASALTESIIEPTDLASGDYATLTANFTPEADGVYYFALHAISDPDMFYLYADNFSVIENNPNAPEAVARLEAKAAENCELAARVSMIAPAQTIGGAALEDDVTITLMRDGEEIYTVTVAPEAVVSYDDTTIEKSGLVTYTAVATCNGISSDPASVQVYVGEDTPSMPENFTVADLNNKVGMTWDPVTTGAQGADIIPENIKYNVYAVDYYNFFGYLIPFIDTDNPYVTGLTETQYELDYATNDGDQQYTYFGLMAENTAGLSNGTMSSVLTGAPYELPVIETFANGLDYWWGTACDDDNYDADGGLALSDDNEFAFDAKTAGWIDMYSGKINIATASNPTLSFDYKGEGSLVVTAYGLEKEITTTLTPGAEYAAAKIALGELASEPWIRFTIRGEFDGAAQAFVKDVMVTDLLGDNVKVTVAAPAKVVAGKSADVTVTVKNEGENQAAGYAVKVYADDEVIAEFTAEETDALGFMETAEYVATVETTVFTEAKDITVRAEVEYDADEKPADNADETIITVVAPTAAPVESVTAVQTDGGVDISWVMSVEGVQEITEDFESYDADVVYADGESCGNWKAVDNSKGTTYSFNSGAWNHMGEVYAFGIIDMEAENVGEANSGTKAAIFMSEVDADSQEGIQSDKYMISPELPGVAQTIKFNVLPLTDQYGEEEFEVLASSTDTNVESFTKVAEFSMANTAWEEVSADLPAGTKYFAIHYKSTDIFGLYVDDIVYSAGGATPTGYNVYIDGVQVASVDGDTYSYVYTGALADGTHTASVTAVYDNAESAPVSAEISIATGINEITNANAVDIYTVDGIRMTNVKNLKKGVYVINGKKAVIK